MFGNWMIQKKEKEKEQPYIMVTWEDATYLVKLNDKDEIDDIRLHSIEEDSRDFIRDIAIRKRNSEIPLDKIAKQSTL